VLTKISKKIEKREVAMPAISHHHFLALLSLSLSSSSPSKNYRMEGRFSTPSLLSTLSLSTN
jgi:hypothetical protein